MATSSSLQLSGATDADVADMTRLYAHHVLHGTGSFEEEPPTCQEMHDRWWQREQTRHPTIIARHDEQFAGFAYAGPYKPRSAYRFTVEDSIYIEPAFAGRGIGYALLMALIERCAELHYKQMIAVIGDSDNQASIALHTRCGFRHVGVAHSVGFKYGRWLDVVFMQRELCAAWQPTHVRA